MFIHIAKDFMKKLEDVDARLSISLDKDEIQTLGLKLRFYHNELRHYRSLFNDIHNRIIDIQKKYGFTPEEQDIPPPAPAPAAQQPAPEVAYEQQTIPQPPPEPAQIRPEKINTLKVLSEWVAQLEQDGKDPNVILAAAAEPAKPKPPESNSIDFNLPEEDPETQQIAEPAAPVETHHPQHPDSLIRHKEYAPPKQELHVHAPEPAEEPEPEHEHEPAADEPEPISPAAAIEDIFENWAANFEPSSRALELVCDDLLALLQSKRGEISLGLDQALAGKKITPDGPAEAFSSFCWGRLAHALGRNGQAVNLLQQAISGGITLGLAYHTLAQACLARGLYEKSLMNYKFASKIDPKIEAAVTGEARSLILLNRSAEALDLLRGQRFTGQEIRTEAALLQAEALDRTGRGAEAKVVLETAAQATPSSACRALLLFQHGLMLESGGDVMGAIAQYESAIESDPSNLPARFSLGRLYIQHQAYPLAREQFNFIIKKHPYSEWADKARELL